MALESWNQLFIIVFDKPGTMVGRRAYRTFKEAEAYLKKVGPSVAKRYRIERYLPAPLYGSDED